MKLRYLLTEYTGANKISHLINAWQNVNIQSIKILVFHHIGAKNFERFQAQIKRLRDNFEIVGPNFLQQLPKKTVPREKPIVMITFDDGFKSSAIVAEQILDPLDIKSIFFISPGFINCANESEIKKFIANNFYRSRLNVQDIPDDMTPMNWEDIRKLIRAGHTIGAHTINHLKLSEINNQAELVNEIIGAGAVLENKLGVNIDHFAYPFGNIESIDTRSMSIIKSKYRFCHSAIRGNNYHHSNPYALLRDPVSTDAPGKYIDCIVNNAFGFLYKRRARQLSAMAESS